MASVRGASKICNIGIFALQTTLKQKNGNAVKLSHVVSALGIKERGSNRSYSSDKGNFLSKFLGRSVSPHTDAHSKVLTESLALYELQCKYKWLMINSSVCCGAEMTLYSKKI